MLNPQNFEAINLSIAQAMPPEKVWPDPDMKILSAYRPKAPQLPLNIFGEFWSDWLIKSGEGKGSSSDYCAGGLLACASVLIGNSIRVSPWASWQEPPIIWLCAIGNPSSGKTPGLIAPIDLIRNLEVEINHDFEDQIRDYEGKKEQAKIIKDRWKEECKQAVSKLKTPPPLMPIQASEPDEPCRKRLYACDATVEILSPMIAKNPKGILFYRDELSGWIGGMNQYKSQGGSDRAFWLESYNGNAFTVDRVKLGLNGAIYVPSLFLSIVGGIQPEKLNLVMLNQADDGLTARFLYMWPEPIPPRKPRSEADNQQALECLRRLQRLAVVINENGQPVPNILRLHEDALPHFEAYRNYIFQEEQASSGLYLSYSGKNGGRSLRLALVLEMLNWCSGHSEKLPEFVSEKSMVSAIGLLKDYFDPMAKRAFDTAALPLEVRHAVTISKCIKLKKLKIINARQILRSSLLGSIAKADDIHNALSELEKANWIISDPEGKDTGGRPKSDWIVNPKVHASTN